MERISLITELLTLAFLVAAAASWIHYIIEPGRILGVVGKLLEKQLGKKEAYPFYLQWFGCNVCLTFWLSVAAAVWLGSPEAAVALPLTSHIIIRIINRIDI